jgi:hypothetical protein
MGKFREQFPQYFALLGDAEAEALEFAIANEALENWEPTEEDIRDLCAATAGNLSDEELVDRALGRVNRTRAGA